MEVLPTEELRSHAARLLRTHPLRAADAVHLAAIDGHSSYATAVLAPARNAAMAAAAVERLHRELPTEHRAAAPGPVQPGPTTGQGGSCIPTPAGNEGGIANNATEAGRASASLEPHLGNTTFDGLKCRLNTWWLANEARCRVRGSTVR